MDEKDLLLEQLKIASEMHRHIDNMAWQGLSHLLTWNGILFSALGVILVGDSYWTPDSSGRLKVSLPSAVIAILVALLGTAISIGWVHLQRRSQMYHRVRIEQARRAEKKLAELVGAEGLSVRLYPDGQPLEIYASQVGEIRPRSRWWMMKFGKYPNHGVVFWIALFVTFAWLVVLAGGIFLLVLSFHY